MKRLLAAFIVMWLLAPPAAVAKTDLSKLNRVNGVSVNSEESEARIVVRFAKDLKLDSKPVFYEKSVQFDLKGAFISPAKNNYKFGDSLVSSAAAYQLSSDTVRLRLFLKADPRKYKESWSSAINGELLIFTLNKKAAGAATIKPALKKKSFNTAQKASGKEKDWRNETASKLKELRINGDKQILPSSDAKTKTAKSGAKPQANKADLNAKFKFLEKPAATETKPGQTDKTAQTDAGSKTAMETKSGKSFLAYEEPAAPKAPSVGNMFVKMIASLSFVVALILLLAWGGKKYLGNLNSAGAAGGLVNVLATGTIGLKQQVTVVDVGGEVMILGISGENITLLANVNDQESMDKFRRLAGSKIAAAPKKRGHEPRPESPAWAPDFAKKVMDKFRIGKVKAAPKNPPAIFDETEPETFAGQMAQAAPNLAAYTNQADAVNDDERDKLPPSRDDLMKKVTSAIKARNTRLRIA